MRLLLALPLLLVAGCNVTTDDANDQTTIEFNGQRAEEAVEDVGNAVQGAGAAISNEVGDIDVDLDVNRNESGNSN